MKKIFICLIFCTLGNLVFAQNNKGSAKPAVDSIAMMKEFQQEMLKAIGEEFKPSAEIKNDQLADHALPVEINESVAKERTNFFLSSFGFRPSPFSGESSQLLIEFDNFFFPGPDIVEYNIKWLKALDKSNKDHLLVDENTNSDRWSSMTYGGQTFLKLKDTFQNKITKIEAEISIKTPSKLNIVKLEKSQLNKTFTIGTATGRLLRLENDFASIWINTSYENFQLIPFNARGQALEVSSNTSFAYMADKETIKSLKLPKDLGPGSLMYIKANGVIHRVDVYEMALTSESKNKFTILPTPILINGVGTVTNEKYENYLPKDFSNQVAVDSLQIKDNTRIKIRRLVNDWDKTVSYRLEYALPSDNLLIKYAKGSFLNLKFFNKKKLVKESEIDGFYDSEKCILYCTPQNEEYNALEFDEVQGTVSVNYPQAIASKTFLKPDKKAGILAMAGHKLTLDRDALSGIEDILSSSELQALRVYGKSPLFPLKKDSYSSSEFKDEKSLDHSYYLGNITSVQMDIPTGWTEVSFPFKVTLTPDKTTKKK